MLKTLDTCIEAEGREKLLPPGRILWFLDPWSAGLV
jgi:hypothetical protein